MICTGCEKNQPESEFWNDGRRGGKLKRCKSCRREYMRQYRARNPGMDAKRYWKDPDAEQERHLVRKYGITLGDYEFMFEAQDGKCAICGLPHHGRKRFDVDHCHTTGTVRGLLCTNCNRMIGHAGDDPERLRSAAAYLESSRRSRPSS